MLLDRLKVAPQRRQVLPKVARDRCDDRCRRELPRVGVGIQYIQVWPMHDPPRKDCHLVVEHTQLAKRLQLSEGVWQPREVVVAELELLQDSQLAKRRGELGEPAIIEQQLLQRGEAPKVLR